jgi:lysozyme
MALCALCLLACDQVEVAPDRSAFTTASYALTACPDGPMLEGIDVSKWQGYVDWSAVADSGIDFAFIRVSDGLNYQDAYFQTNWSEAKANGVVRGAYQFFRSDEDPVAQAQYLLEEMGPLKPGDLPPVCDVETADGQSPATIVDRVQTWLDVVEEALGVKPFIYTSPGVWGSIVHSGAFADYPLWVAHWGASCPSMPTGWSDWVVWQTSDSGSVPGVNGGVDTNLFNGDMEALLDFAYDDGEQGAPGSDKEESAVACPVSLAGQTLIQEDGPCAKRLGLVDETAYEDIQGNAGHAWWTSADEASPAYREGVAWLFEVQESGSYSVWAHVPADVTQVTSGAVFEVQQGESISTVVVDLSAHIGGAVWLGTFEFVAQGGSQQIRALDSFTVPSDQGAKVCFDALEIGPASYCACDEAGLLEALPCGDDGEMTHVCDGCQWSSWSACDDAIDEADVIESSGDTAGVTTDASDWATGPSADTNIGPVETVVDVHSVSASTQVFTSSAHQGENAGCQTTRPRGGPHGLWWVTAVCLAALGMRRYRLTRLIKRATP